MKIAGRKIGVGTSPYIIAEISANHNGSVEEAKKLIQTAHEIGCDAVKIQCYTAKSIAAPGAYQIKTGPWKGKDLYELYKEAETPPKMVKELFEFAKEKSITLFSSVFDFESVDLVTKLGAPAIKIASFELVDLPLIECAAKTGLPMIISTGMGSTGEIIDAMNVFYGNGGKDLCLLHCISEYPASPSEANLPYLGPLSELLGARHAVGISDHTLGIGVAVASVALGSAVIEKHLTLDRTNGSADASFSLEPSEFSALIKSAYDAYLACRSSLPSKNPPNAQFRKSLYAVSDIAAGEAFSKDNVKPLRPALGLPPKLYRSVLAGVATQDVAAGTPLSRSMVSTLDL